MRWILRSKIHQATVTGAHLNYIGSITIDKFLLEKAGLVAGEKVLVVDNTNGARLETYIIEGKENSGEVSMNGASSHLIKSGDEIIVIGFELSKDGKDVECRNILVNDKNQFVKYL